MGSSETDLLKACISWGHVPVMEFRTMFLRSPGDMPDFGVHRVTQRRIVCARCGRILESAVNVQSQPVDIDNPACGITQQQFEILRSYGQAGVTQWFRG